MSLKNYLIEKVLKHPLDVDCVDINQLTSPALGLTFDDLRQMLKRIYNVSEKALLTESDATTGPLGVFNCFQTWKRQRSYFRRINNGFVGAKADNKLIVAEGDSWFQFIGRDIISWLKDEESYAVYSMAYGGDWLSNILLEEKYIEELSIHKPAAFLVSGGGNDLVGGNRLAMMICPDPLARRKRTDPDELLRKNCTPDEAHSILMAQGHILKEFHAFLLVLRLQYILLFTSLQKAGELSTMAILTQGYDYTIPYGGVRWKEPFQPLINWLIGSGKWLSRPMLIRGIRCPVLQRAIIMAMLFELNEMFVDLARSPKFPNLYHIDCRGTATGFDDWYDELHLRPFAFQRIAKTYRRCLDAHFDRINQQASQQKLDNPVYDPVFSVRQKRLVPIR